MTKELLSTCVECPIRRRISVDNISRVKERIVEWDRSAATYARTAPDLLTYGKSNAWIARTVQKHNPQSWVDLACGTGLTTQAILERVPQATRVVLMDQSKAMLSEAETYFGRRSPFVFLNEDACDNWSPRINDLVDCVVCNAALWQFRDVPSALREVAMVLRSGSPFIFTVPDGPTVLIEELRGDLRELWSDSPSRVAGPPVASAWPTVLADSGYSVSITERIEVPITIIDLVKWWRVPIFRPPGAKTLSESEWVKAMVPLLRKYYGKVIGKVCWRGFASVVK